MKIYTQAEMEGLPRRWISTDDGLPPLGEEVNVHVPERDWGGVNTVTALCRKIGYEGDDAFYWDNAYPGYGNFHTGESVKAWMPLPKPPRTANGR